MKRIMTYLRWAPPLVGLAAFISAFRPEVIQWWVDGLWVLAVILSMIAVRQADRGPLLGLRPARQDVMLLVALLAAFAAAWLPFYNNWRWAYTGDSIAWYALANEVAHQGLMQNLLSVHGVDNNFTYIHSLAFNSLMFVFEPNLFWHRVGKLTMSCLSLAAIYAYFTLTLGRWWAAAVLVATAVNYVWLWFSYVSYGHIDSHIFYFLTLFFGTLIWRHPDQLGKWMLCGLVGGFALFFTQTSWSAVAAAGIVLGGFALVTKRFAAAAVYAFSFLLAAAPVLLQFPDLLKMTTRQAGSVFQWNYLVDIFRAILLLPYDSNIYNIGVQGAFVRWPLGPMYLVGVGLAAIAVIGPVRRWLRIPTIAPVLLGLLLWDALLMTLTNNGYSGPSTKRCYNLIPLQVFLALVPAYCIYKGVARWKWPRRVAAVLTCAALVIYAGANLRLIVYPRPAIYGFNAMDGLIEIHQRLPERRVALFTTSQELQRTLDGMVFFKQQYHVTDRLTVETHVEPAALDRACQQHALLCYEPNKDRAPFDSWRKEYAGSLTPFPVLNSSELVCYDCVPAATG